MKEIVLSLSLFRLQLTEGRKVEATSDRLMDRLTSGGESALTLHCTFCHHPPLPSPTPPPHPSAVSCTCRDWFYVHIKEMSIIITVRIHMLCRNESRSRKERLKGI